MLSNYMMSCYIDMTAKANHYATVSYPYAPQAYKILAHALS